MATERDLRDYFRLPTAEAKARIAELVEAGALCPSSVEGWRDPAYLDPAARFPRRVDARARARPFDSLIWDRDRVERLFGFRYRIEIYVPASSGCTATTCCRSCSATGSSPASTSRPTGRRGVLRVQAAHAEEHAPPETAERLRGRLEAMAAWLGLEHGVSHGRGDLAI